VLYISYDGASEPLGRSQVVAYLIPLAESCEITLISFEKPADDRRETAEILAVAGIEWVPLAYNRRPPVISTAWDIIRGAWTARRVIGRRSIQVTHARSYVSAAIALLADRRRRVKFLFDIRGFWVDERVEGGIWPRDGWLYRAGKRCEKWLFSSADAVVTLTRASVPQVREWVRGPEVQIDVIPTCADVERYGTTARRQAGRVTWCGSIGTFYRFDLAVELATAIDRPLTVLTRQQELAREVLAGRPADVRSAPHERVPDELAPGDIGLCLYSHGFANIARAPTRFAEYLAAGMTVAVSAGVGDLESLVGEHRVGAVIESEGPEALARCAQQLRELSADPDAPARCQGLACELFSLEAGVREYLAVYGRLVGDAGASPPRSAAADPIASVAQQ
jgi:glycosyltransferase involved in cell wall biosynthesis